MMITQTTYEPTPKFPYNVAGAEYSTDMKYRYILTRTWGDEGPRLSFIGLNPSTATETVDDPTIRRIVDFAQRWGFSGLDMFNIFAFRATDPKVMKDSFDPIGKLNDDYLLNCATKNKIIVAGWGTHGSFLGRGDEVAQKVKGMYCLGFTKEGHPKHPLYLSKDTTIQPFNY